MRRLYQDVPVTKPDTARCSNIRTGRCGSAGQVGADRAAAVRRP